MTRDTNKSGKIDESRLNAATEGAVVTDSDKAFQARAAATGNTQLPTVT